VGTRWYCIHGSRWVSVDLDQRCRKEEIAENIGRYNFRKREVKPEIAIIPRWLTIDKFIEHIPVGIRILVPNLFSSKGTILITEHGNKAVWGVGWVGE
jgi:hypothetical protein